MSNLRAIAGTSLAGVVWFLLPFPVGSSRAYIAGRYGRPPSNMIKTSPNKPMQRAGTDKVPGRGRLSVVHEQVHHARVLNRLRAVADGGRWATLR
jgi:hypothetical protein